MMQFPVRFLAIIGVCSGFFGTPSIPQRQIGHALSAVPPNLLPYCAPTLEAIGLALLVPPLLDARHRSLGREDDEKLTLEVEAKVRAEFEEREEAQRKAAAEKEKKRAETLARVERNLREQKEEEERVRRNQEEAVRLAQEKAKKKMEEVEKQREEEKAANKAL